MRVVVSYDISDDKRRRKVAEIMEGYGYRVQYSVFECNLNKKQMAEMKRALRPLVKGPKMDSIRFYPLPADAVTLIQVIGKDQARSLGLLEVV
ncbi:MAG: CRISPR-associated endonuclease Cas2 [Ardenticatenaceae bacterium]|nr:CRISPR-associated endonuclease Cas2 [Anaerolineales bacterium]MCB9005935.1 CRISPR-associated endonuclease Cas2 [Ardenticatenaceae bacterium]